MTTQEAQPIVTEGNGEGLTLEETVSALRRERREAATLRSRVSAAEAKLAAGVPAEEVERVIAEERAKGAAIKRALAVENAAIRYRLPDELADVLKGDTPAEIEAHALVLAKYAHH